MNRLLLAALALSPALLSCGRGASPPKAASADAVAVPPPEPASQPPDVEVTWPEPSLSGVPGWLGLRAGAAGSASVWTGIQTTASVVVLGEAWAEVPPGTPVRAVGPKGTATLRFRGVETARYGCDDLPLQVAAFDGEAPGDLFWLTPLDGPAVSAEPLQTKDTEALRTWSTSAGTLGLHQTGTFTAELWVHDPAQVLRSMDLSKDVMDGWEPEAVELSQDFLVPQVVGIWSVQAGPSFAMAAWSSFEGDHFTAYLLGQPPAEVSVESLYRCAF